MPGNIRDILFGSSTFRLNWTFESMMSDAAARDDIHGLPVLFPRLDLAAGKFASQMVSLDDEAASMLRGKRGEPDLARPSLPDKYAAALIRVRGPCPGEVEGMRLFEKDQARQRRGGHCEFEQPIHAVSPCVAFSRVLTARAVTRSKGNLAGRIDLDQSAVLQAEVATVLARRSLSAMPVNMAVTEADLFIPAQVPEMKIRPAKAHEDPTRAFSDFSEFKAAIGTEMGASEWIEITQGNRDAGETHGGRPVESSDEAHLVCYL